MRDRTKTWGSEALVTCETGLCLGFEGLYVLRRLKPNCGELPVQKVVSYLKEAGLCPISSHEEGGFCAFPTQSVLMQKVSFTFVRNLAKSSCNRLQLLDLAK